MTGAHNLVLCTFVAGLCPGLNLYQAWPGRYALRSDNPHFVMVHVHLGYIMIYLAWIFAGCSKWKYVTQQNDKVIKCIHKLPEWLQKGPSVDMHISLVVAGTGACELCLQNCSTSLLPYQRMTNLHMIRLDLGPEEDCRPVDCVRYLNLEVFWEISVWYCGRMGFNYVCLLWWRRI